jgi:hypothetical protein
MTLAMCMVSLAFAHNGVDHTRGVVKRVEQNKVWFTPDKGEAMIYEVDEKTEIERGQEQVRLKDLRAGDRARVDSVKEGTKQRALKIKLSDSEDAGSPGNKVQRSKEHAQ